MKRTFSILLAAAAAAGFLPRAAAEPSLRYPETRRVDHIDEYHGAKVEDPYRWLEGDVREAPEVAAWVEAQNKITFGYLESIPEREPIRKRLTAMWNFARYSAPIKKGGRYFHTKNDGLQNQSVLYVYDSLDAEPRVLLDPNAWSKDGTVALTGTSVSEDGRLMAYGQSEAGSDWSRWNVMEIDTGRILPDELRWIKFSSVAWTHDNRGFFYMRFPEPKEGEGFQSLNLNARLMYHRLGTEQQEDTLVYARPDQPEWSFSPTVTEDGRYLVITISKGTDEKYRVLYRDLQDPLAAPVELIDRFENEYSFVGNERTAFYFLTDKDAPRRRLIAIDLRAPGPENWKEIIPQKPETLVGLSLIGNQFVATYLKDARTQVVTYTLEGKPLREIEFPGIGAASGFGGERADTETFYTFQSFATPPSIYRYDLLTGESRLLRRAEVKMHPEDFEVSQVFFPSKDGTRIPMFISHKKGVALDGNNPTLLYGYGGFNAAMTPSFSISRLAWMEMGGVYAMANLRGGGEYGEEWHQAGTKLKKQNVFDDFIAAAEWLIANKYTRREKLAIDGRSNGGLLVGATLNQRPDLFGAALPGVGVMDMLRFQKFTAGRYWTDDYGSSDNADEFKALLAYSPYHNIREGTKYPPTLVTTADTDDRVVPSHSFKYAARLQKAQAGDAPTLIRIETRAGHGGGKPTAKVIEEVADQYAFLVKSLAMDIDGFLKE